MTQEEKQILLNDLKCRLYTGTQCQCIWSDAVKNGSVGVINELDTYILDELEMIGNPNCMYMFSDIKPCLRPLESMTEDEKNELSARYVWRIVCGEIRISYHSEGNLNNDTECSTEEYLKLFDWLNAHHFDYRNLIEMDLALQAPEGMYKIDDKN